MALSPAQRPSRGFTSIEACAKSASSIPDFPGDHRPLSDRDVADELYVEAVKPL